MKLLARQGAIYVKIKDGFDCLLKREFDCSEDESDNQNSTVPAKKERLDQSKAEVNDYSEPQKTAQEIINY